MGEALVLEQDGFIRMPNSLLEALSRMELSGREFRTVMAIYRFTAGFGKEVSRISLKFLSNATGIAPSNLVKLINRLAEKGILIKRKIKNRLHLGLKLVGMKGKQQATEVETKTEPTSFPDKPRDLEQKKASKTERETRLLNKKSGQNLDKKPEGKEEQPFTCPGRNVQEPTVQKLTDNAPKAIDSSREKPEERREIIEAWERIFGKGPDIWTKEQIIAADYMLYLLDNGGLQAVNNPIGYLNKIAEKAKAGLIEDFDCYRVRKEKAFKAQQAYERRLKLEKKKAEKEMKKKEEADKKAEKIWKELKQEQKEIIIKIVSGRVNSFKKGIIEHAAIKYISRIIQEGLFEEFRKSMEGIGNQAIKGNKSL